MAASYHAVSEEWVGAVATSPTCSISGLVSLATTRHAKAPYTSQSTPREHAHEKAALLPDLQHAIIPPTLTRHGLPSLLAPIGLGI